MADSQKSNPDVRLTSVRKVKSLFGFSGRGSTGGGFFGRHLWVGPVLALVALVFAATWLRAQMEAAIQTQTEGALKTLLDADVTALKLWLRSQEADATTAAQDSDVREPVLDLIKLADAGQATGSALLLAPQRAQLEAALKPWLDTQGFVGYVVVDKQFLVLASNSDVLVGQTSPPSYQHFSRIVLQGKATVSRPYPATVLMKDEWGQMSTGVPTMFVAAPVRNDQDEVVAVLALRIQPDKDFTDILNVARMGETGETYAFDDQGVFLSQSRFEDQLKQIGLQVDQPNSRSVLAVQIRDPGVDLTQGGRATVSRSEQPLTEMAKQALATKKSGVNVQGYRDYRGVMSVGAWTWLPEYGFAVVTEMDKAEAYGPVFILRRAFWILVGLLSLAAISLLGLTLLAGKFERRMREAVIAAGKVGQYSLEEKIGEGGMGAVYRGRHAMLRRPTAIKLLEPSRTTELSIARFEREVHLTSELNHPNTITIYDYGRTPEGVFYYAMEFLDGFSLQSLVDQFGPQPDGRVIQILLQVGGSLSEAHSLGLIHRDIKPANIMLTQKGGVRDYVKLLDFGLVKAIDAREQRMLTAANTVTGTPLYIPPEIVQDPDQADARSDLYSLGAVAYFLLTGSPVFEADNVLKIVQHHISTPPVPPSQRTHQPICSELEQLVLACLAKSADDRPQSASQLIEALTRCVPLQPWTTADANAWWNRYRPSGFSDESSAKTEPVDLTATMAYSDQRLKS